jgi:energy-coupling factor transporter ATP-binding protein EcfA2
MHPSEVEALLAALAELRDEGNTVIVVEHDPLFMAAADHLIELGPGAGIAGGQIVAQGTPGQLAQANTTTAQWLSGQRQFTIPATRRPPQRWMTIHGARANNLRDIDARVPLGTLTGVCGVSGSGKSTLMLDTLGRALVPRKQTTSVAYEPVDPGEHDAITGAPSRAILMDQSRRGIDSPMTYLGLTKPLLSLYAESEDALALRLDEKALAEPCSVCKGRGSTQIDMGFLPGVHVPCDACQGTGCCPEAWDVRLGGVALPECQELTVDEVYEWFGDVEELGRVLKTVRDVGLGYLVMRQPGYTLSSGEAQRLKIASELCRKTSQATLYILDEPTVGQSLEDVRQLVAVLHRLVEEGHSVIVIEHHPHMLAACDWLIAGAWHHANRPLSACHSGENTMNWAIPLLADASPCLRLLVLRELLKRPDEDHEARELEAMRLSDPLVADLLALQRPEGFWPSAQRSGDPAGNRLQTTAQALMRLGYLGLRGDLPATQRGAAYLFAQQRADGSWPLFKSHERDEGNIDGGYDLISLQTSMPLRGLAMCGYATDPRAERAYEWLLAQRLPDGAWPTGMAGGVYGRVAGYRRLAHSRWGCRTNTTAALICLAHHPERRLSAEAQRALDLVLGRETHDREYVGLEVARLIGLEPMSGRFTYFARFDLALVLDLCWRVGASQVDPRIADLADFIVDCQGDYGLWDYVPRPEASRWVTFDLRRSLSHLSVDTDWHSTEPRTPFSPYHRVEHRY